MLHLRKTWSWFQDILVIWKETHLSARASCYSRPLPFPNFFKNTSHSKLSFSSIMDQYHIWFCLFCTKCQCAQVKGRQPFVSSPLINTKALNISSALRKGLWDVTVFNTRCLRNSLHSQSLLRLAFWVCLQRRRLCRSVFCKLFNKGSFSWKQFHPQDPAELWLGFVYVY